MKRYHYFLIIIFSIAWILSAIHPTNHDNWLQENIMIFLWVPSIILLGRYIKLNNFSYTLITIFLLLHLVGTHYNYGSVPFGRTLGGWLGGERNQYDRFVHFSFGFFITYPIREFFQRAVNAKGFWSYLFPILISMSFSASYEIFEWIGAIHLPPDVGYLFIGGNDPWDSQKDMALGALGAITSMIILIIVYSSKDKQFWAKLKIVSR